MCDHQTFFDISVMEKRQGQGTMRRRVHSPLLRAQAATEHAWLPQLRCKQARTAYTKRGGAACGQCRSSGTHRAMSYRTAFDFCPTFPPTRIKSIRRRFYRGFLCLMLVCIVMSVYVQTLQGRSALALSGVRKSRFPRTKTAGQSKKSLYFQYEARVLTAW